MNILTQYLANPKTRRVLAKKPTDAGFSLIELVVVVAVLAVLVAVALPNFQSITHKARVNQGKNALVTALKECNVTEADTGTATYTVPTVDQYTWSGSCTAGFAITSDGGIYPKFDLSAAGAKTCSAGTAKDGAYINLGCTSSAWSQ